MTSLLTGATIGYPFLISAGSGARPAAIAAGPDRR